MTDLVTAIVIFGSVVSGAFVGYLFGWQAGMAEADRRWAAEWRRRDDQEARPR